MGGCSAPQCKNNTKKGFRMFSFPRNPQRRQIWTYNCGRCNWVPTNSSKLCEVHFEDSQYENHRQDGKRLLKPNAIPTVFSHGGSRKMKTAVTVSPNRTIKPDKPNAAARDHSYISKKSNDLDNSLNSLNIEDFLQINITISEDGPEDRESILIEDLASGAPSTSNETTKEKDTSIPEELRKLRSENQHLRAKVYAIQRSILQSRSKLKTMQTKLAFLTSKQFEYLTGSLSGQEWDDETIRKALLIRYTIGIKGYEFLRKQGYPLPSYCTLCRKIPKVAGGNEQTT